MKIRLLFFIVFLPLLALLVGEVFPEAAQLLFWEDDSFIIALTPVALASVTYTPGLPNLPGTYGKIYIIRHDDIETWPTLEADGLTYDGDFVLKATKKFEEIYFTNETGDLKYNGLGEIDNGGFEHMIEIEIPAFGKDKFVFDSAIINGGLVLITTDSNGEKFVLGSELIPAYRMEIEGNSGKKVGDKKGTRYAFRSADAKPPRRYEGLFDATIVNFPV